MRLSGATMFFILYVLNNLDDNYLLAKLGRNLKYCKKKLRIDSDLINWCLEYD